MSFGFYGSGTVSAITSQRYPKRPVIPYVVDELRVFGMIVFLTSVLFIVEDFVLTSRSGSLDGSTPSCLNKEEHQVQKHSTCC